MSQDRGHSSDSRNVKSDSDDLEALFIISAHEIESFQQRVKF